MAEMNLVATPALTPAHSPRRGRILRCVWSLRRPSVLQNFSPANHPPAAIGNSQSAKQMNMNSRGCQPTVQVRFPVPRRGDRKLASHEVAGSCPHKSSRPGGTEESLPAEQPAFPSTLWDGFVLVVFPAHRARLISAVAPRRTADAPCLPPT